MPVGDLTGDLDAERGAAERTLEGSLERISADVKVERLLVEGDPAALLAAESANADLVVVGSRGHGGLKTAFLGSVSNHVIQHAACPVVVVRAT